MNESSPKLGRYAVIGGFILCLLIILGWFAFHEERSPLEEHSVQVEQVKPQVHQIEPIPMPTDDAVTETLTNQPNDSAVTNAADLYRLAFDLFKALTNDEKDIVRDWQTNVDAAVEAEICEKIRPIVDLVHQASAMTNCDWGVDPKTSWVKLSDLNGARNMARASIWDAAHCRSNDVVGVMDDILSTLRLGQQVSQASLIGCLVDMAVQGIATSYIAQNLGTFRGADAQRLTLAVTDPTYAEAPGIVMGLEADELDRRVAKLSSLPADEAKKYLAELYALSDIDTSEINPDALLANMKQAVGPERDLAKALTSSSQDEVEAWQQSVKELSTSNPLAAMELQPYSAFVDKVNRYEVNRAMTVAGLAIAENGTDALAAHPDPASGKPFTYTETEDGFELQSAILVNDKPYKIRFK